MAQGTQRRRKKEYMKHREKKGNKGQRKRVERTIMNDKFVMERRSYVP